MKRPPGHTPSDFASTAMSSIVDRVHSSEAYRKGRSEVVQAAINVIGPSATVAHLKALGGITAIVRTEIAHAKTPGLDKDLGSSMFPLTARELLAREAGLMRTEVQVAVARTAIPTGHATKTGIRYLKITQTDGQRFILRVTAESRTLVEGIEVDAEGEEVVPRGTDDKGRAWHNRLRIVLRDAIKKAVEMRMNPTYATLEAVPKRAHAAKKSPARLNREIDEVLRRSAPADKLEKEGVVTMQDLDRWIERRPQVVKTGPYAGQRELMSRYQALKSIVGENAAIEMLNNLAIEQCTAPPRGKKARR